jgi:hypothetical protein
MIIIQIFWMTNLLTFFPKPINMGAYDKHLILLPYKTSNKSTSLNVIDKKGCRNQYKFSYTNLQNFNGYLFI